MDDEYQFPDIDAPKKKIKQDADDPFLTDDEGDGSGKEKEAEGDAVEEPIAFVPTPIDTSSKEAMKFNKEHHSSKQSCWTCFTVAFGGKPAKHSSSDENENDSDSN